MTKKHEPLRLSHRPEPEQFVTISTHYQKISIKLLGPYGSEYQQSPTMAMKLSRWYTVLIEYFISRREHHCRIRGKLPAACVSYKCIASQTARERRAYCNFFLLVDDV